MKSIINIKVLLIKSIVFSFFLVITTQCQAQGAYSGVYAKRQMMQLDKNKNDVIDKFDLKKQWSKYQQYDLDSDEVITLEELSKRTIPILETKGKKSLNILYKVTPEEDLYLDVYYPEHMKLDEKLPIVVYTHGGGWFNGSKENIVKGPVDAPFLELLEEGFAVVSINYRLVRHKTVMMRDCVIDAMDALRYLSKNSEVLNLDTNRVFVLGDSAGGHIAQMITLADSNKFQGDKNLFNYSYKIVAGVSWYGPSDFTIKALFETDDNTKVADRFGARILKSKKNRARKDVLYKEMSPFFYLTKDSAPLYMMAADNDTTIPVAHAYHMKEKADRINADVELFVVKNAGHNWRKSGGDIDPTLKVITQETVNFILKHK